MSEPSPEAKQAAIHKFKHEHGPATTQRDIQAFAEGYDTATTKLREELDFIKTEHAILNARLHGEVHPKDNGDWHGMINIPKLREELEHKSAVAQSWFDKYQQLAHHEK